MKIERLAIEDFLSIGHAELVLDDIGLCLIQGCNNDNPSAGSNGAGKSAIVEAVTWGLYGETARGIGADAVIRHGAKRARVTLVLRDEETGIGLVVTRTRQKGKGLLALDRVDAAGMAPATLGTEKLTQEALVKALGCSAAVFTAAVCLGQEQMPDLPSLTDRKLKELIEEAAGVGVLEQAYALARERCLAAEKRLTAQTAKVDGLIAREDALVRDFGDLTRRCAEWEGERADRINAVESRAKSFKADRRRLVESSDNLGARAEDYRTAVSNLDSKLAGFTKERATELYLQGAVTAAERALAAQEAKTRHALEAFKAAQERLASVAAGVACDACGQSLPEGAHKHACDGAAASLAEIKERAQGAAGALREARAALAATQEALAAQRAGMSDPSEIESVRAAHVEALARHDKIVAAVVAADKELIRLADEAERLRTELCPWAELRDRKEGELRELRTVMLEEGRALKGLEAEHERLQAAVKVFGPAGVRAHVLDTVTPYLNERTAAYLDLLAEGTLKACWSTLTRDAKGALKERFAIEVEHPAGSGFGALSGGEKRKVRIACALALQDLVASRATKPFRLWICDEADDALDEAGLERFMAVLQDKAKEKGTVLVISHRDMRDWISSVWTVTKTAGISEVSV